MSTPSSGEITQLLLDWSGGDEKALSKLMPLVYGELRQTAAGYLRKERVDHTLETAALVNETYLRLVKQKRVNWRNRLHFYALAAQIMRRILVDHARSRGYQKRGGGAVKLALEEIEELESGEDPDVLTLHEALKALAVHSAEHARIVELQQFGGLTQGEIAKFLGISPATVARRWRVAKTWLFRYIEKQEPGET